MNKSDQLINQPSDKGFLKYLRKALPIFSGGGGGGAVNSVNGQTGTVVLDKSDIGLPNVDNTSDADKPISTLTQNALNNKANLIHTHSISEVTNLQSILDGKSPINRAIPNGGTTGQVLKKQSNTDYDVIWAVDESTIYVINYAALPDPTTVSGKTYGVLNSTGVPYITALFGGSYLPKGFYYSDGSQWIYVGEFPVQATQTEVNTGTVADKFVSPATLKGSPYILPAGGVAGQIPVKNSDTDYDFAIEDLDQNDVVTTSRLLGGDVKACSVGLSLFNSQSGFGLTTNRVYFVPVVVKKKSTITGVYYYQTTQGVYNAQFYNGFGLHQIIESNMVKLVESVDDGNTFKAAAGSWTKKAFSSPIEVLPGLYYISVLYNFNTQTTAPVILGVTLGQTGIYQGLPFNNVKTYSILNTQNTLPASVAIASLSNVAGGFLFLMLY